MKDIREKTVILGGQVLMVLSVRYIGKYSQKELDWLKKKST